MSPTAFARAGGPAQVEKAEHLIADSLRASGGAAGPDELRSPVHTTIYIQSYILSMTDRIFACDVET